MTKSSAAIAFFDAKPYDILHFTEANKQYAYDITFLPARLNEKNVHLAGNAPVVCAFVNDVIQSEVVDALYAQGVRLIALRCAGYNNVDLKAVFGKINVVRVPSYSPHSIAEFVIALLLSLTRKIHQAYNRTHNGNFLLDGLTGRNLHGRSAGIIGTGKIGKITAELLRGFGMNVYAYDAYPDTMWASSAGVTYTSFDDLCRIADVISLHCPLSPQTFHLINAEALSHMKTDAVIVNTGRGALIDTIALVASLKNGEIGGAALDVYEEEDTYFYEDWSQSVIQDDTLARLLLMPNVILTSHQAFLTSDALTSIAQTTLSNIKCFFDGRPLQNEICYQCTDGSCQKKSGTNCF